MKTLTCIRVKKMSAMSIIKAAEAHGRRLDEASARRVDRSRTGLNLAASQYSPDDPLSLETAFRAFKKQTGAVEGKGAAIMAHMIAVISPEVLAEAGDPRDPDNPKVRLLFDQAQAWARSEFGESALVAARLDVDEAGAGVVDLFVCPTAMQAGGRGRKPKLTISIKSGIEAVAARYPSPASEDGSPLLNKHGKPVQKRSYSGLQDSWGEWASQNIDPRLRRGKPKTETGLDHVHADLFRAEKQALTEQQQQLAARAAELDRRELEAEAREAEQDRREDMLNHRSKAQHERSGLLREIEQKQERQHRVAMEKVERLERQAEAEIEQARANVGGLRHASKEAITAFALGEIRLQPVPKKPSEIVFNSDINPGIVSYLRPIIGP